MPKFTNNVPTSCTIRGDWEARKIYIDDEAVASMRFSSDAEKSLIALTAYSILCHYLPVRIAKEMFTGFMSYVSKFPSEDFEWKNVNLRKAVLQSQKNEMTYAY